MKGICLVLKCINKVKKKKKDIENSYKLQNVNKYTTLHFQ